MPEPGEDRDPVRRAKLLACLALVLLVWLVYGQSLSFGYTNFDDPVYVTGNRHVLAGLGREGLAWAFTTTQASNWHPLTWLSHMLDATLGGPGPALPHAVNVALHAGNAVLVFLLFGRATRNPWASLAAAAVFAVHPLRAESVAWVAERKDVLSMAFGLLTLDLYVRYAQGGSRRLLAASIGTYLLALLAKPMLVSLPILLLLLDCWPLARGGGWRRLAEKAPYALLALASCVVTFLVQRGTAMHSMTGLPLGLRLLNVVASAGAYLGKAVVPIHLSAFYPFPPLRDLAWSAPASVAALGILGWLAWRERIRRPYLAFGLLWYLAALLPVSGLVQVGMQGMADRYTYLPLLGPTVAVTMLGAEVATARGGGRAALAVAGAAVVVLGGLAFAQVRTWRSTEALFRHAVAVDPGNYLAQANLGIDLLAQGRCREALGPLAGASRLMPGLAKPHFFLARALRCEGRREEALGAYRDTLAVQPHFYDAQFEGAETLADLGRGAEARRWLQTYLGNEPERLRASSDPGWERARSSRARALLAALTGEARP